jgi:hypothetical protein
MSELKCDGGRKCEDAIDVDGDVVIALVPELRTRMIDH